MQIHSTYYRQSLQVKRKTKGKKKKTLAKWFKMCLQWKFKYKISKKGKEEEEKKKTLHLNVKRLIKACVTVLYTIRS